MLKEPPTIKGWLWACHSSGKQSLCLCINSPHQIIRSFQDIDRHFCGIFVGTINQEFLEITRILGLIRDVYIRNLFAISGVSLGNSDKYQELSGICWNYWQLFRIIRNSRSYHEFLGISENYQDFLGISRSY